MASGELSLTSNSSQEGSHEFNCYPNEHQRKPSTDGTKTYDTIKQQYDQACIELNSMRLQQTEGKMQMERVMEQLEFYRDQYLAAMNQIGQSTLEGTSLRSKYAEISNENIRLQQRIHHLEKKVSRQEKENGNSPTVCTFVEQYNELKKKYDGNRSECEKLAKEMEVCKKLCSDLSRDRNSLALEKDDLKQQLSTAFGQLEAALRDKNMYREARDKLSLQHDGSVKEMSQVLQQRAEELRRVTAQRNAAELELRTILGERKGVLEENQKLSDDLAAAKEELENHYKSDKSLAYENESLKREIDGLMRHRDDVLKERNTLRAELDEMEMLKSREGGWTKNMADGGDKCALNEQHCIDLEAANNEIEKLHKSLDRAKCEIDKSAQETEVAKSRRDWAISEREKIVQERDSVKTLCDELRKERDTAVSDLLAAIRDSEQIKKQKDEAHREVEHLREQIESQVNCSRRNIRWSYMPFEMDALQKNDTDVIELDMNAVGANDDIGIMLEGSREEAPNRNENGIVVVGVAKDSPAYGKLRVNDCIVRVNNLDCSAVSKRLVFEAIRNSAGERCNITVKRHRVTKAHMYAVQLNMAGNRNHGVTLETGIFITKIMPNSLAAKEAELSPGDRILSINNKTMEGVCSGKDAMAYLDDNRTDSLNIIALKQITRTPDDDVYAKNKPNRVMNTCTQTDERHSVDVEAVRTSSSGNAKSSSKISEMFNKFRGRIHMHAHSNQKGSTASESDSLCQENDAIAVLDSVLNNENVSTAGKIKENLFKRSKKAKKENTKEANKNLGTWPRANIMNTATTQENHTGTIVQHRKKERPALSLFTGPITLGNDEKSSGKDTYFASHPNENNKPGIGNLLNRNSNPIPFNVLYPPPPSVLNRHSVYSALETEPVLCDNANKMPSKIPSEMAHNKYYHHHHHHHHSSGSSTPATHINNNRLSLNINPSLITEGSLLYNPVLNRKVPATTLDFVALKNSTDSLLNSKSPLSSMDFKPSSMHQQQDLISLKSQNSIDSFLASKGPPSMDMTASAKPLFPRDSNEFYQPKRSVKNVSSKFPSDSDSLGMESISSPNNSYTSTLPSYAMNSRTQTMVTPSARAQRMFSPFPNHLHPHHLRQTSPLTVPMTQSLDIAATNSSADKLEFDFVQPMHSHGVSMDVDHYTARNKVHPIRDRDVIYGSYGHAYEGGTFPRKKENQRVRIPSNPSVASKGSDVKNSTGSIEHGSEHGSPMPPAYKVEVLSHGVNKQRSSMPDYSPCPGDLRRVTIDKSAEPLGITIQCNNNGGGIFVSTVTANSIASQVGLQIGDQLLEVCGINMRDATHKIAAKILRQCGNAMTMLVQYCPEKYDGNIINHANDEDSVSRSGSPTPRNSPRGLSRSLAMSSASPGSTSQSIPQAIPKRSLLPTSMKKPKFSENLDTQSDCSQAGSPECYGQQEPRVLTMHTKKTTNLGISLMGGNAVGIYVHDVQKNSIADLAGLKKGDQILEYNGVDLRRVTAESAATEISKPADNVTVLVQHNMTKFNQIKDEAGDSLYIRAGFDRTGDLNEGELRFVKDDVLYVDTTIFRGKFGQWRAWKLDEYGHRLKCGIIPSQLKVEEELRFLSDTTDGDSASKRTLARRSFFRRKKHQRSSSRDSKDLSSFSSTQLSWFSDSGIVGEDGTLASYQRVERLNCMFRLRQISALHQPNRFTILYIDPLDAVCRPVLILGPLADSVAEKLTIDFPQLFQRCLTTTMNCTQDAMEKGLQSNIFVDYRRRGSIYECTTVQAIRELGDKNRHCILDVGISAIERLKRIQIYPIVLLLRFKSAKQIKEIKDSRYCNDKTSAKAAKEMYEHALKLESDYRQYISAVIPAGVNITHMSTQIKAAVDEEQSKVLWVPVPKP